MRNIEMLKKENMEIIEDLEKQETLPFDIIESIRDKMIAEYWDDAEEVIHANGVLWGAIIMLESIKDASRPASELSGQDACNDD